MLFLSAGTSHWITDLLVKHLFLKSSVTVLLTYEYSLYFPGEQESIVVISKVQHGLCQAGQLQKQITFNYPLDAPPNSSIA